MQIITGKYRARRLLAVDKNTTRPTLARVKESIFNLIQTKVTDSIVLDLFAGTGAFGCECISRGAKKVYFVDKEEAAIKTIKINTAKMVEDFEILKIDYMSALNEFFNKNIKFDIVYLDPPYKSDFVVNVLNFMAEKNILNQGAIIIVEHSDANDLKNIPNCYIMTKSKKYGIAYVDILMIEN